MSTTQLFLFILGSWLARFLLPQKIITQDHKGPNQRYIWYLQICRQLCTSFVQNPLMENYRTTIINIHLFLTNIPRTFTSMLEKHHSEQTTYQTAHRYHLLHYLYCYEVFDPQYLYMSSCNQHWQSTAILIPVSKLFLSQWHTPYLYEFLTSAKA